MEFKDRLKDLRVERGISQMQLAKELKLSQSAIAKWELGKTELTATAIITVANYFDVSIDYLLGRED